MTLGIQPNLFISVVYIPMEFKFTRFQESTISLQITVNNVIFYDITSIQLITLEHSIGDSSKSEYF